MKIINKKGKKRAQRVHCLSHAELISWNTSARALSLALLTKIGFSATAIQCGNTGRKCPGEYLEKKRGCGEVKTFSTSSSGTFF